MYEARQYKEKASRQIGSGEVKKKAVYREKHAPDINNIIQTYRVSKREDSVESYETAGKVMTSASDKINFYKFVLSEEKTKEFPSLNSNRSINGIRPQNRKEYYEAITESSKTNDYWIKWPPYATGDLPSMGVALLMGFKHGINIERYGNITPQSKLNEVCAYLGGAIDPEDDHYIVNGDGWKGTYGKNISGGLKFSWLTRVVAKGKYENDQKGNPEIVKQNGGYDGDDRKKVRESWLGKDYLEGRADNKIQDFLSKNYNLTKDKIQSKQVTVLWIRKSGERGGAHYENDTSFHALSDYINRNREELIILAGDKKEDKTTKLVETDRNRVFDLTEFWKVRGLEDWGGNTRTGQLRLYDYINKASNGNLKHIGSMSGGLEALALLGHNVMFKGKMGEGSVARMEQYKENSNINYDWIGFKRYSPLGYDYRGYEKSAAKYYVFFSSIGIRGKATEDDLKKLYQESYRSNYDYKIKGYGLNGENAATARSVSKFLAKAEKQEKKKKKEEQERKRKQWEKEYREISRYGNPNHRQDGRASKSRKKRKEKRNRKRKR